MARKPSTNMERKVIESDSEGDSDCVLEIFATQDGKGEISEAAANDMFNELKKAIKDLQARLPQGFGKLRERRYDESRRCGRLTLTKPEYVGVMKKIILTLQTTYNKKSRCYRAWEIGEEVESETILARVFCAGVLDLLGGMPSLIALAFKKASALLSLLVGPTVWPPVRLYYLSLAFRKAYRLALF